MELGWYQDSSSESQPLKILRNISHGRSSSRWIFKEYSVLKWLDISEALEESKKNKEDSLFSHESTNKNLYM